MAKTSIEIDKELKKQCTLFLKNTDSNMHYLADLDSTLGSTEWLEIMEETFPYIDKVIRDLIKPKGRLKQWVNL